MVSPERQRGKDVPQHKRLAQGENVGRVDGKAAPKRPTEKVKLQGSSGGKSSKR